MFDKIIIAVGVNPVKKEFLNTDCRIKLIQKAFHDTDRVEVEPYFGLTVDFCEARKFTYYYTRAPHSCRL